MKKTLGLILFSFFYSVYLQANTLDLAKASLEAENYSKSLKTLQTITKQDPANIEALYYLSLNHYLVGNYEEMIRLGVKAYTKDHTLAKNVRQYANNENFGADVKIGLFRKIRLARQIRNELYFVLQSEPDNVNAHYALGYYYILTPYLLSGSIKKSLYHINYLADFDIKRAYPIYSAYYRKTKDSENFLNNLTQWYKKYPDDWNAVVELSRHEQTSNPEKSYELLTNWLQSNTNDVDDAQAIYQIGRLAATTGDYLKEGETSLLQYLELPENVDNPEHKWAHYRLSMIYQHLKEMSKVQEHITKALEIDPKNSEFLKFKAKL